MKKTAAVESLRSLSIRYWYSRLRARAGLTSVYKMEQTYEPDAFSYSADKVIQYRKNKWTSYRLGKHRPQNQLLRKVEMLARGSTRDLNHPLWVVLDINNVEVTADYQFLSTLSLDLQRLLNTGDENWSIHSKTHPSLVKKLLQNPDLDVLAYLTWCLRSASEQSGVNLSPFFLALHNALVLLTGYLEKLEISNSLLNRFIQDILPMGLPPGLKLEMCASDYLNQSVILDTFAQKVLESENQKPSRNKPYAIMAEMLGGKYGFDLLFASKPRYCFQTTDDSHFQRYSRDNDLRDSALQYLMSGPHQSAWKPSFEKSAVRSPVRGCSSEGDPEPTRQ